VQTAPSPDGRASSRHRTTAPHGYGTPAPAQPLPAARHTAGVGVAWAEFSPDGTRLVTASYDGTARLWDARTGAAIGKPLRIRRQSYRPGSAPTARWCDGIGRHRAPAGRPNRGGHRRATAERGGDLGEFSRRRACAHNRRRRMGMGRVLESLSANRCRERDRVRLTSVPTVGASSRARTQYGSGCAHGCHRRSAVAVPGR
jgi:hypothetical protein